MVLGEFGMELRIYGRALLRFTFDYIPSVNEAINEGRTHWAKGASHTKVAREKARNIATQAKEYLWPNEKYLIQKRALVVVSIYRDTERKYDITNAHIKPVLDGFTDAGVWPDDDWANLPVVVYMWKPSDDEGQRFVISVYELMRVSMNGVAQILPSGRTKERG